VRPIVIFAGFVLQTVGLLLGLVVIWQIQGMARTRLAIMPAG
jgi:hypothetical protein